MTTATRRTAALVGLVTVGALTACGSSSDSSSSATAGSAAQRVRLGYFPNVTHALPIVADAEGFYRKHLGATTLTVSTFNAGPAAMEALKSGAIDATYVGPGPATSAYLNSNGAAVRVVAGAALGGSALVVDSSITAPADLKGKKIATPQLGNTQDIAARYYLKGLGFATTLQGGGDVTIMPQDNSAILDSFAQKAINGAWVPEPYVTRLVALGGHVLVDEKTLWPNGKFPTTVLAVNPTFLAEHPDAVKALLAGQLDAEAFIAASPAKAQADVGSVIAKVSGKALAPDVIAGAWKNLQFTNDPVSSAIATGAQHAYDVGILTTKPDLAKLVDLTLLNSVLSAAGKPQVAS
jgi:NitT/TauT family transport system substrate-binding protein